MARSDFVKTRRRRLCGALGAREKSKLQPSKLFLLIRGECWCKGEAEYSCETTRRFNGSSGWAMGRLSKTQQKTEIQTGRSVILLDFHG